MAGVKVLVVDDEQETIDSLQMYLELQGFTVFTAPNGEKAVALINQHHPDVVLLDVNLQGSTIGGLQVLKTSKEQSPTTLVWLITGYDADKYKEEGLALGADKFLEKPLALDKLVELIKNSGQPST